MKRALDPFCKACGGNRHHPRCRLVPHAGEPFAGAGVPGPAVGVPGVVPGRLDHSPHGLASRAVVALAYLLVVLILITAPLLFVPRLMALFGMLRASLAKILAGLSASTPTHVALAPNLSIDLAPFYASVRQEISSLLQSDPNGGSTWTGLLFPFANRGEGGERRPDQPGVVDHHPDGQLLRGQGRPYDGALHRQPHP